MRMRKSYAGSRSVMLLATGRRGPARASGPDDPPRTASTTIGASRPSTPASRRGRPIPRASTCTSAAATSCASRPCSPTTSSREYARDLWQRWRTYRTLDRRRAARADAEPRLRRVRAAPARGRARAPGRARRRRSRRPRSASATSALLERLNPGRVFRIRMPVDDVVRRWAAEVRPEDRRRLDAARRLELVNLLLPTRLWVTELEPGVGADARRARRARAGDAGRAARRPSCAPPSWRSSRASRTGCYPVRDGAIAFDEFTAIYPVGTFNEYTTWNGRRIPYYPTPGRRTLTTHQRTLTVDHIPTDESYSYSPWLPYMHVGTNMHNSFHTLWWQMEPARTGFLPAAWRTATAATATAAVPLPLAPLARADVARLHARERRPHRRAAPAPAGRDRAPLRRRRLLQPVAALRRLRHRRRPRRRR